MAGWDPGTNQLDSPDLQGPKISESSIWFMNVFFLFHLGWMGNVLSGFFECSGFPPGLPVFYSDKVLWLNMIPFIRAIK